MDRRRSTLGFLVALVSILALVIGMQVMPSAAHANSPNSAAVWTVAKTGCVNNGLPNSDNCNIYMDQQYVLLAGSGLSPNTPYFAFVTDPSGSTELGGSYTCMTNDSGVLNPYCTINPFAQTPNPGGEYKALLCTSPVFGSGTCFKSDNFKIEGMETTTSSSSSSAATSESTTESTSTAISDTNASTTTTTSTIPLTSTTTASSTNSETNASTTTTSSSSSTIPLTSTTTGSSTASETNASTTATSSTIPLTSSSTSSSTSAAASGTTTVINGTTYNIVYSFPGAVCVQIGGVGNTQCFSVNNAGQVTGTTSLVVVAAHANEAATHLHHVGATGGF